MSDLLNNVLVADDYTDAATLRCPEARVVDVVEVNGGGVIFQLGFGHAAPLWDTAEVPLAASTSIRRIYAAGTDPTVGDWIRFRNRIKGQPATTVTAWAR
jgi:hypothetical protein